MVDVVKNNMSKIMALCKQHHVLRLYVFGSAARETDFTQTSDVDFLVTFSQLPVKTDNDIRYKANNYEQLHEQLQSVTDRKVDLIPEEKIKNKYLRYFIDKDKKLIYGIS